MEIDRYGWKYIFNESDRINPFIIIPYKEYPIPETLSKIYALNDFSLDALLNSYVYATHPSEFNDLYDCHEQLIIYDDDQMISTFLQPALPQPEIERLLREKKSEIQKEIQPIFRDIMYRKIGVFSMTSDPNNILMWSYYSKHEGFLIEFNYKEFPFKFYGAFPVNYQEEIHPINISECDGSPGIPILYQTNIKHKGWEHESEWRLLIDAENDVMFSPEPRQLAKMGGRERKFSYPPTLIKSVALGNRFFHADELTPTSTYILDINLKINIEKKSLLLDFISHNNIQTYIAIKDNNLATLHFTKGEIQRIDYKRFRYNLVGS